MLVKRSVSQSTIQSIPEGLWGVSPGDDVSSLTSASRNSSNVSVNEDHWDHEDDEDEDCWIREDDFWSEKCDITACYCTICQGHLLSQDAFLEAVSADRQLPPNVKPFRLVDSVCDNKTWLVVGASPSRGATASTTACFLIQHTFISILKSVRSYYSCTNTAPILPPSIGSLIVGVDSVDNDGCLYINCYLSTLQFDAANDFRQEDDNETTPNGKPAAGSY
jgi:hypothetical protein